MWLWYLVLIPSQRILPQVITRTPLLTSLSLRKYNNKQTQSNPRKIQIVILARMVSYPGADIEYRTGKGM